MAFLPVLFISTAQFLVPILGGGVVDQSLNQDILISFSESLQTVFDQVNSMSFSSMGEKRTVLTFIQKTYVNEVQGDLQRYLKSCGVPFEFFWISNKIVVRNASAKLICDIAEFRGVSKVEKEPVGILTLPMGTESLENKEGSMPSRGGYLSWSVQKIRADRVWKNFTGKGIVVANIDSGVRHTHETLNGRWRSSQGWFDPYEGTLHPNDGLGHGTHTMGTIAGSHGIGVAPEATYIACKGANNQGQWHSSGLYRCGQWIQCPTDPDGRNQNCSQAPRIVSNSWQTYSNWYDDVIKSWHASGIIPVFSAGNGGPNCSTTVQPASSPDVIAVGCTTENDSICKFSSLGPTFDGRIKPDISAPGMGIISATSTTDTAYRRDAGTSMAAPHISGVIALMLQKNPTLNYDRIFKIIATSAETNLDKSTSNKTCGGKNISSFPNNVYGYGRIDALTAVNSI